MFCRKRKRCKLVFSPQGKPKVIVFHATKILSENQAILDGNFEKYIKFHTKPAVEKLKVVKFC